MKVFVWNRLSNVSDNYHSGGGLVVFADNEERACQLATEHGVVFSEGETVADDVRVVDGGFEAVYIMPDAGCC